MTEPTPNMRLKIRTLQHYFRYSPDGKLDNWRILDVQCGQVKGDCDDFALTLAYELSDRSLLKMWVNLTFFRIQIWYVKTPRDVGHAVLRYRGMWADNTQPGWYTSKEMPHTKWFPWPSPLIALKMLIGKALA